MKVTGKEANSRAGQTDVKGQWRQSLTKGETKMTKRFVIEKVYTRPAGARPA
jgi:hypothetical protein